MAEVGIACDEAVAGAVVSPLIAGRDAAGASGSDPIEELVEVCWALVSIWVM
jgi:hypothetical protein